LLPGSPYAAEAGSALLATFRPRESVVAGDGGRIT
jgi:hypothetical protein